MGNGDLSAFQILIASLLFFYFVFKLVCYNVTREVVKVDSCGALLQEIDALDPHLRVLDLLSGLGLFLKLVNTALLVGLILLHYDDSVQAKGAFL